MAASYYGVRRREAGGALVHIFVPQPRLADPARRPSPVVLLNQEITGCATYVEVLALYTARRADPALDGANICTCVSTCARRCRESGAASAASCLEDPRWADLLEVMGTRLRDIEPRGLVAATWGLAALRAQQPLLLKRIAWQVHQKLDRIDARQLSNVTWAFATVNVKELDMSIAGAQLYPGLAARAISMMDGFRPQELANLLWAFATLGLRQIALFDAAAPALIAMLEDLNGYDLGQTVWAFSTVRLRNDSLLDAIAARLKEGRDEHKPINIANIAWAYAKVAYTDEALYAFLAGAAHGLLPRSNAQDLGNVLWALASARAWHEEYCRAAVARAAQLLRPPAESRYTTAELASLVWSLAKLGATHDAGCVELVSAVVAELRRRAPSRELGPKDAAMCLWGLGHLDRGAEASALFAEFASAGAELAATAFSTVLASAQRAARLDEEVRIWRALGDRADHPALAAAIAVSAALSCHRRGGADAASRALAVLDESAARGATLRPMLWRYARAVLGGGAAGRPEDDDAACETPHPDVPAPAPRREGMRLSQLYAKELEVLVGVQVRAAPASCADVIEEIRRCAEQREAWLKLAGGEKTLALERFVEERRPKLVVEVGFYVGYSSTVMARRLRDWGGRLISIEVDPVHVAIGQVSVLCAGLADVVDVWAGHSSDVLPRLLQEVGPGAVDMVFFDQKGTIYHEDLQTLERLGLLADGCAVVADNVLKPGAPCFLWQLDRSPWWDLQIVSVREYESEAVEDWISVATFDREAASAAAGAEGWAPPKAAPRELEAVAFETDAIRWRAVSDQLTLADWVRHVNWLRAKLAEYNIVPTARAEGGGVAAADGFGSLHGFRPLRVAAA